MCQVYLHYRSQTKYTKYMSKCLTLRLNEPHSQQGLVAYTCITTNNSWYVIFCTMPNRIWQVFFTYSHKDSIAVLASVPHTAMKTALRLKWKVPKLPWQHHNHFFLLFFFCMPSVPKACTQNKRCLSRRP